MSKISVSKNGLVSATISEEIKKSKNYLAIQYLEDGLSYLNYAKYNSSMGLNDPKKDYKTGVSFIMSALEELINEDSI